jgi:hypothetical protein
MSCSGMGLLIASGNNSSLLMSVWVKLYMVVNRYVI